MKYSVKVENTKEVINCIAELVNSDNVLILMADLKCKRPNVAEMSTSDGYRVFFINNGDGVISIQSDAKMTVLEAGRYSITIALYCGDDEKIVWEAK